MSVGTLLSPSRLRGPLSSAPFRLLVTGSTVNSLGNAVTPVALAFGVLELGGSASDLGLVVAAYALAEVVTLLFGGVLGDRLPRQVLMQGAAAGAAVTQGVIAAALIGGWASVTMLGLVGLVNGCLAALSRRCRRSSSRARSRCAGSGRTPPPWSATRWPGCWWPRSAPAGRSGSTR